jgi:5-methylcytosine-specific restriction endonuclease McrA
MPLFENKELGDEDLFRSVVLYGRNVASYKFALAESLILLGKQGNNIITLDELAVPFSNALLRHLKDSDKQGISKSSTFLNSLRSFKDNNISKEKMLETTSKLGFVNVIDAFHRVGTHDIAKRFFLDERNNGNKIVLTDELLSLSTTNAATSLTKENDARWKLVETAWEYGVSNAFVTVEYDKQQELLIALQGGIKRKSITGVKDAISGYQRGLCFYCSKELNFESSDKPDSIRVDHLMPFSLMIKTKLPEDIDRVWNLVLACNHCNGASEKSDNLPDSKYVKRLLTRNEFYIQSHHPLRETLILQTGTTKEERFGFVTSIYEHLKQTGYPFWRVEDVQ